MKIDYDAEFFIENSEIPLCLKIIFPRDHSLCLYLYDDCVIDQKINTMPSGTFAVEGNRKDLFTFVRDVIFLKLRLQRIGILLFTSKSSKDIVDPKENPV